MADKVVDLSKIQRLVAMQITLDLGEIHDGKRRPKFRVALVPIRSGRLEATTTCDRLAVVAQCSLGC